MADTSSRRAWTVAAQKLAAARARPRSRLAGVNTRIGGQLRQADRQSSDHTAHHIGAGAHETEASSRTGKSKCDEL